jgi:hypothetical protein
MITRSLIPACLLGLISCASDAADLPFVADPLRSNASTASDGGIAIGVLTCGVKGGPSFIVGSRRELRCVFHDYSGDRGDRYGGQIQKLGLDVGIMGNAQLNWTVLALVHTSGPAALAGRYAGIGAGATVGVGAGANLLIGGSLNTISLQPLSVQGQTGFNASLAVASIELHPFFDGAPESEPPLK